MMENTMSLNTRIAAAGGVLIVGLTLGACGGSITQSAPPTVAPASAATSAATPGAAAHNAADAQFAQSMIVHHRGAVEMADLAVSKATGADVRALATGISAAQGPEITQLSSWLQAWGEPVAAAMADDMLGMDMGGTKINGLDQQSAMKELKGLTGSPFDQRFLVQMTAHHEVAVSTAKTELTDGKNPDALNLAQKIIDAQTAEIDQMKSKQSYL
jgi:uncharacterized protein (DUF305 family)